MANDVLTPTDLVRESLMYLHQGLNFIPNIDSQYDKRYNGSGAKKGDSLDIQLPPRFSTREGWTMDSQDYVEKKATLTVADVIGVDLNFTSRDLTMDLPDFGKKFLKNPMKALASKIESKYLKEAYKAVYNTVGTPGTTPNDLLMFGQARQKLVENLAPEDDRFMLCDPATITSMVSEMSELFNRRESIDKQFRDGFITDRISGFDWYENTMMPTHTTGSRDNTTPVTNAATPQTGTSLICENFDATATIKEGDVFIIADVYQVHPETKEAYSHHQQFVVTEDATCVGGAVTLKISPEIIASGPYQNVSNGAADGKALTFYHATGSTPYVQNLAFQKNFATFVSADIELPTSGWFAREEHEGISMRIWKGDDINNSRHPCRIDVLAGFLVHQPALACRVTR